MNGGMDFFTKVLDLFSVNCVTFTSVKGLSWNKMV